MLVQWVGESHPSDDLAVVALGCVVRGDTPHFDYVCSNAMTQLQAVSLKLSLAFGNGLLTVDSIEQARARESKGAEAVQAALWMYHLKTQLLGRVKGGHGISSSQS
jgi:6,7-dimethyl-8-ribityllumazine synthase